MTQAPLKLLLVEDSEDDAALILAFLYEGGYQVECRRVYTREGLHQALAQPGWDVIISDHNLPSFSAIDALLMVLESRQDVPFIIVSGTIGEELAVEAMKAGAQDFVMKSSLGRLAPSIANAIHAVNSRRANIQAQIEIRESRERLRELTSHLETVREEERARLAREIHDELGGILTALKMDISWLGRRVDTPELSGKLASMTELTDGAIKTMRRIITDLRPSVLDDLGLVAALEWQLREFQQRSGLRCYLDLGLEPDVSAIQFGEALAVAAFRIFQESLTNIARHAGASRVDVHVGIHDHWFMLDVVDDGCGVAGDNARKPGSYGLLGMRERARHLGGNVTVTGAARQGTTVSLRLPLGHS